MNYFIPKQLSITNSSIPEHTDDSGTVYPVHSKTSSYVKDTTISYKGSLFKSFQNIYPLATYSWNDIAMNITPTVIRLSDNVTITPTSVPCVANITVVYIQDTWKTGYETVKGFYFKYTGTTGNVDFTTINPSSPSNFTKIENYRHEDLLPTVGKNTLYWEYLGRTNRWKVTDLAYNSQAIVENTTEVWWEAVVKHPQKVTAFNIQAKSAKITIYTTDINTPIYENTISSLLDTSSIINWRTLSLYEARYTKNASWNIPFLSGEFTVRVTLFSDTPMTIKAGEILAGDKKQLGMTLDGVPMQIKSSGKITELENGDVVLEDEGDITKVYLIYNFSITYDTNTHDSIVDKCTEFINRRIVVEAEDSDNPIYRSLVFYGFVRESSPTLTTNSTQSKIEIQAQRFK